MGFLRQVAGTALVLFAVAAPTAGAAARVPAAARRPVLVRLTSTPALFPAYSPQVHDYVVRCQAGTPVRFTTWAAAGTTPFIDGQAGHTATVALQPDQEVTVEGRTAAGAASDYHVRCLPPDFPTWTVTGSGTPGEWYVTTPTLSLGTARSHYVVIFDANGVPVWWYESKRVPIDAKVLSGPTPAIAFASYPGSSPNYEIRRLDGTLVRTVVSPDGHIDDHELQRDAQGDYYFLVYQPKQHVDLTPYGGPADGTVLEAEIEEVNPAGQLIWSWSTDGHVSLSESQRWLGTIISTPVVIQGGLTTYDFFHANAISLGQGVILLSLRQTDGVYAIDKATGQILWKLGGTPTPESLTVVGDPDGATPLGGQHDVRLQPDGTVSVFDDDTFLNRPPRVVRYQIDTATHTATLVQSISDPAITSSACCGSARSMANGDWLVSWGADDVVGEYGPDGTPKFKLTFGDTLFSYRAGPVAASSLSAAELRAGMDAMAARSGSS